MDYEEVISNFLKLTSNIDSEYRIASELLEEQNQLTLGKLRKMKKQRQYRVYRYRVIDEEDLVEQP